MYLPWAWKDVTGCNVVVSAPCCIRHTYTIPLSSALSPIDIRQAHLPVTHQVVARNEHSAVARY